VEKNPMKCFSLIFYFFLVCSSLQAQQFRIGLFNSQKLNALKFSPKNGNYYIFSDTILVHKVNTQDVIDINPSSNGNIELNLNGKHVDFYPFVSFVAEKNENFLEVKVTKPNLKPRLYEGDFKVVNKKGYLELVNEIDLEQYLEGVVESESGPGQKTEYYKVQATISRTYALKYKNKHESAGFNLCDGTHCQAYLHKRNQSSLIDSAVKFTRSIVLLDSSGELSSTFFHANCGGQTCEPDQVWNEKIVGFKSFRDTFCIHTKQANWMKKIPVNEWFSFLEDKYRFPTWDSVSYQMATNFIQSERKAFYINPFFGIPLRDIRDAFKLKSTYFNCKIEGDFMVLTGKGFGHGVGLCQEGAMNMSKYGFRFEQIISFYYPNRMLAEIPISFSFPRR
jgi:stage II sporulation protein D